MSPAARTSQRRPSRAPVAVPPPPELDARFPTSRSKAATVLLVVPVLLVLLGAALVAIVGVFALVLSLLGAVWLIADWTFGRTARLMADVASISSPADHEARLSNLLEGLCLANGIAVPPVRVIDDQAVNAVALASGRGSAVLLCTKGLLARLDRIELEAVIAWLLATIKLGQVASAQKVGLALGAFARQRMGARLAWQLAAPERHVQADRAAAAITRYPPGLVRALQILEGQPTRPQRLPVLLDHLSAPCWLVPFAAGESDVVRPGELDLELRIAALAEL